MQSPVLLTSKLTDVTQVLLSEFQDLQLAITLLPVQRWVQVSGEASLPGVPLQQGKTCLDSAYLDGKKWTTPGDRNKIRCPWDSTGSDGKQQTIPRYHDNKMCLGSYILWWRRQTNLGYCNKVSHPKPHWSLVLLFIPNPINSVLSEGRRSAILCTDSAVRDRRYFHKFPPQEASYDTNLIPWF